MAKDREYRPGYVYALIAQWPEPEPLKLLGRGFESHSAHQLRGLV